MKQTAVEWLEQEILKEELAYYKRKYETNTQV